jgi:hypothetical protein
LKYPDPESRKVIVGTLCEAIELMPSPAKARELYELFSTRNAEYRKYTRGLPRRNEVYPQAVNDFMTLHMDAYQASAPPIASRVSADNIDKIVMRVSARNTNKLLGNAAMTPPAAEMQHAPWMMDNQRMMSMMMQNMCQHFQMMQGGDINLRMCGQSGSNNVPGLGNSPESSRPNNMPALGNSPWSSPQGAPGPNNMSALGNSPGSSPQGAPDTTDIHRRALHLMSVPHQVATSRLNSIQSQHRPAIKKKATSII